MHGYGTKETGEGKTHETKGKTKGKVERDKKEREKKRNEEKVRREQCSFIVTTAPAIKDTPQVLHPYYRLQDPKVS